MRFRGRKCAVYGSKLWGLRVKTMGLLYRKPPDTTDNRQRTTDNRQRTTDNGQQTTDNGQQTMDNGRAVANCRLVV